jgi:hypothetical protein
VSEEPGYKASKKEKSKYMNAKIAKKVLDEMFQKKNYQEIIRCRIPTSGSVK